MHAADVKQMVNYRRPKYENHFPYYSNLLHSIFYFTQKKTVWLHLALDTPLCGCAIYELSNIFKLTIFFTFESSILLLSSQFLRKNLQNGISNKLQHLKTQINGKRVWDKICKCCNRAYQLIRKGMLSY